MKFGRHDIKHLAIIGACAAAGIVATGILVDAARGPHVRTEAAPVRSVEFEVRSVQVQPSPIRIRAVGAGSLSPIVYVDGVRVNGPGPHGENEAAAILDDLAAEDIAGVEVVKGDKALFFGTEGKERGVILVTTKKGPGEGAEKGR